VERFGAARLLLEQFDEPLVRLRTLVGEVEVRNEKRRHYAEGTTGRVTRRVTRRVTGRLTSWRRPPSWIRSPRAASARRCGRGRPSRSASLRSLSPRPCRRTP